MAQTKQMRSESDTLFVAALVFISYLAATNVGSALLSSTTPTVVWPAAGIALACAYLLGTEALAAIFLAQFVFSFFVSGDALTLALTVAAGYTIAPALGAYFLKRFAFHTSFARLRDAYLFIVVALVAAVIAPIVSSAAFVASGTMTSAMIRAKWGDWYVGNLLSVLVVAPFLLRWLPKLAFSRTKAEWIEAVLALGTSFLLSVVIFATPYGTVGGVPLIYILLLPLFWIGLRLGPRFMTLALLMLAAVGVMGTIARVVPPGLSATLFSIELLIAVLAIIFLLLVSVAEERKDATQTLRRQLFRLEEALEKIRGEDQAKNDFIALLAHELRNPLAPLLSSLELLRLEEADSALRSSINAMRGRVRTMGRLLDDLLDLSRIEHRTLTLALERIDLVAIATRALETTQQRITEKHQALTISFPESPIEIAGDPVRLEQVIVNLLTNASKYTELGGSISLSLTREGREAVIRVSDTGAGIQPAIIDKIFEPFRQGEPGRRAGGLGIGLALSKNLVSMHGGTIAAASEGAGKGSSFTVRLPLSESAHLPRAERARQLKKLAPSSPLSLLIVDDNRAAADSLAALLRHVGHKVATAYDAASGIEQAKKRRFAALVLDIGLPDMSGYELARKLREEQVTGALIALTGYGQEEDKKNALAAGFEYHLVKPVSLVDIEDVLRAVAAKALRKASAKRAKSPNP